MEEYFVTKASELFNTFLKQNFENEYFDIVFHVQGKELYAHSLILAQESPVFKQLFIKNHSIRNEPIIIDDYSYDEFFEFLRCIYCHDVRWQIPDQKLFPVIELAELYKIEKIKKFFNDYLDIDNANVEQIFTTAELAHKYYMKGYKIKLDLKEHIAEMIEFDDFIHLEKSVIEGFLFYARNCDVKADEICESVYKWGEYRAIITDEMTEAEKNGLILNEIKEFIPLLLFEKMSVNFLFEFAIQKDLISIEDLVRKAKLWSFREASEIEELCEAVYHFGEQKAMILESMLEIDKNELVLNEIESYLPNLQFENMSIKFLFDFVVKKNLISLEQACKFQQKYVRITISNGHILDGSFVDEFGIYDFSLKMPLFLKTDNKRKACFHDHQFQIPLIQIPVEKRKGCEWYLLLENNGTLSLKHESLVNKENDFLIAELKSNQEFCFVEKHFLLLHVLNEKF